jgi:hypothetical protein
MKQPAVPLEAAGSEGAELDPGSVRLCEPVRVSDVRLMVKRHGRRLMHMAPPDL